jgi:hypothetical protein
MMARDAFHRAISEAYGHAYQALWHPRSERAPSIREVERLFRQAVTILETFNGEK